MTIDPMLAHIPQSLRIRTLLGSVLGIQDTQFCEHALTQRFSIRTIASM